MKSHLSLILTVFISSFIHRPHSSASVGSQDSVNLDDIIRSNDTIDIQETGLMPYLEDLDIDDTNDEFWKMDEVRLSITTIFYTSISSNLRICYQALTNMHISKSNALPSVKATSKIAQPQPNLKMLSDGIREPSKRLGDSHNDTSSESSLNNRTIDEFDVDNYWGESIKVSLSE